MKELREALLRQYIGAIIIGMLAFQALFNLFSVVLAPVYYLVQAGTAPHNVLSGSRGAFDWNELLPNLIRGILYLIVSYILMRWLYAKPRPAEPEPALEESA